MKPFDDRFADRVREVFDRHEEAFDPKAWDSMKARLAKERKPLSILLKPYVSRAAAVLILVVGMAWLLNSLFYPGNEWFAGKQGGEEEVAGRVGPSDLSEALGNNMRDASEPDAMSGAMTGLPPSSMPVQGVGPEAGQVEDAGNGGVSNPSIIDYGLSGPYAMLTGVEPADTLTEDPSYENNELPEQGALPLADAEAKTDSRQESPASPVNGGPPRLAALPAENLPLPLEPVPDTDNGRALSWSVAAGSMMTYAGQQLAAGMGFSGGVISEWKATKTFRFSSGLLLAYQQFAVDGMPLHPEMDKSNNTPDEYVVRTYADQEYEMLAFDIPLNIQYRFMEIGGRQWFVSAGLSSLLYLQQHVSGQETAYVYANLPETAFDSHRTISYTSEVEVEANYDALQRFDFARLLNLSFGYEIKGAKSATIIEPFIKYPLGTLSSREIKMGMGGISLRYRFGQ